jgi:hypothetical protein
MRAVGDLGANRAAAGAVPRRPRAVGHVRLSRRETLRHNPLNAVTASVERVHRADGSTVVRKELRRPAATDTGPWAGSHDPRHWNYWRREAEVYASAKVRAGLRDTGLDLPAAQVEDERILWLEDVAGRPGAEWTLADHERFATALGRWQARGQLDPPWASRRFLRDYSASRPARYELVADDRAWDQPLIRDCWPPGLRTGWTRLLANRERLLSTMERLPRTFAHLDVWVSNEIARPDGRTVLLDWAFAGDGAVGEDAGNHIPDAAFDLFWPAERIAELDATVTAAYLAGLRGAGWAGDPAEARLGIVASCVKYAWLLPGMLARASATEHRAYHQVADAEHLYRQRGLVLAHLTGWCDEALALLEAGR